MRRNVLLVTLLSFIWVPARPDSAAAAVAADGAGVARAESVAVDSAHAAPAHPTMQQVLERADSLVALRGGPHAENARIYLTWDAPWGMPGPVSGIR